MSLAAQIASARRSLRQTKRGAPWLFPEFAELRAAEQAVREAQKRLKAARAAWAKL